MSVRRFFMGTWILVSGLALLAPAAAQAQVIFGLPISGSRPVMLPSYYYPSGLATGTYGYGYGFGSTYGYGYGVPYSGYYPYLNANPYVRVPTYQPITTGLLPYVPSAGLTPGSAGYGLAPRMRQSYSSYEAYAGLPLQGTGYAGTYTSAQVQTAPSYVPVSCAALVCGSLPYAAAMYVPASYAATAVASLTPPPRLRQANYPPNLVGNASLSSGLGIRRAEVDVRLPSAKAEIWFDGVKMTQTGKTRHFYTPRLEPASRYTYSVRARWEENGKTREVRRDIFLRAGDVLEVDLTSAAARD
jgi:uncharacterized protein (TIGR03000 family)